MLASRSASAFGTGQVELGNQLRRQAGVQQRPNPRTERFPTSGGHSGRGLAHFEVSRAEALRRSGHREVFFENVLGNGTVIENSTRSSGAVTRAISGREEARSNLYTPRFG